MITTTRTISVILACILLSSCGGGSGSSSLDRFPQSDEIPAAVLRLGIDRTSTQTINAAGSKPKFGSVTQSSNNDGSINSPTTTDSALTRFDGDNLSVMIRRADGTNLNFDTARDSANHKWHQHYPDDGAEDVRGPLPTHKLRGLRFLSFTEDTLSISTVTVSWNDSNHSDYLAGGYWLHLSGDIDSEEIVSAEVGAFFDGPELNSGPSDPDLPSTGTASYRGSSAGLYVKRAAGSSAGSFEGEIGEYVAPLTLTVDFGATASAISACLGCDGDIVIDVIEISPGGVDTGIKDRMSSAQVRMTANTINPNGSFTGTVSGIQLDGASSASGNWGGKFSKVYDSEQPRLVAGTNGAEIRFNDGSSTSLIGMYFGIRVPPQQGQP